MMAKRNAFTLMELLVVISILAILMSFLMPSLSRVLEYARAGMCISNLRGIGRGLVLYQSSNADFVVPSYNMPTPGTSSAAPGNVLDGWAAILERDGFVPGSNGPTSNIFYCPDTLDIDGMDGGQTAYDQDKPSGYQDWPVQFLTAGGDSATKGDPVLPIQGFGDTCGLYMKNIRCGYFLNAFNPIGSAPSSGTTTTPCAYYTQSVGYGPYADGNLPLVKDTNMASPGTLIVACDGMYMGRQSAVRLGEANRRIGYRHPGQPVTANVNGANMTFQMTVSNAAFADGHAEPINNNDFPHANVPAENTGRYSLLANP